MGLGGCFANDTICPICNRTLDEKEKILNQIGL